MLLVVLEEEEEEEGILSISGNVQIFLQIQNTKGSLFAFSVCRLADSWGRGKRLVPTFRFVLSTPQSCGAFYGSPSEGKISLILNIPCLKLRTHTNERLRLIG